MLVHAVGIERHDDLRAMAANRVHQLAADLGRRRFGEMLIEVVQQRDIADAEDAGCVAQLLLTPCRQLRPAAQWWLPCTPRITARRGHQRDLRSALRVHFRNACHAEAFVVGMRVNKQQPKGHPLFSPYNDDSW